MSLCHAVYPLPRQRICHGRADSVRVKNNLHLVSLYTVQTLLVVNLLDLSLLKRVAIHLSFGFYKICLKC